MTLQVINSPFNEEQVKLLNEILPNLTEQQKIWLNGYLSASNTAVKKTTQETSSSVPTLPYKTLTATILYGSQTGNSQKLAEGFANKLKENQVEVTLSSLSQFPVKNLKKIEHLIIVVSTHGEGEPPDNARTFYEFLHSHRAPKLDHLKYGVLALGDSSYEWFCKMGRDLDDQLQKLGATPLINRVDCDLDFEEAAKQWFTQLQQSLLESVPSFEKQVQPTEILTESQYNRKNPYQAEILDKINLNMIGSNKATYHLELSIAGSGLQFKPGDNLGIYPKNQEALVDSLINQLGFENEEIIIGDQHSTLRDALVNQLEITVLSKPLLQKISSYTGNSNLKELFVDKGWKEYAKGRDLLDAVNEFGPFSWSAQEFANLLRKIPPRLYSIASSYDANPDEVHLTIGKVQYEANGRSRVGVTSGQVADSLEIGDNVSVFVQKNQNFRLPENNHTPIIMIGAGTGIAPYRAFLEQREEEEAKGKSWLFFGEQHFVTDFLYQVEWQRWIREGILTKMDVAFSRDTDVKVYVQHRLSQHAKEIGDWLEKGAVIYVCGDEKTMAHDVHETLKQIVADYYKLSPAQAEEKLREYQKQKRYQRDVY